MDDYESPTVMVVSDKKQNQIAYVYQGPMKDMERFPVKLNSAKNSEMIHFGTGSPVYYLKAMHALDGSKRIALDPAQEIHNVWNAEKFNEALPYAGTFFCNENELKTALRYTELKTAEDLLDIVDMIVNTRGSEGTVIYTKKETIRIPAVKTKVIDPTGAGEHSEEASTPEFTERRAWKNRPRAEMQLLHLFFSPMAQYQIYLHGTQWRKNLLR